MDLQDDKNGLMNAQVRVQSSTKEHRIVFRATRQIISGEVVQFPPIKVEDKHITLLDNPDIQPNVEFVFNQDRRIILKAIQPLKLGEQLIFRVNTLIVHTTQFEVKNDMKRLMTKIMNHQMMELKKEDVPSFEQIKQKLGNPEPNGQMVPMVRNKIFQFGMLSTKTISVNSILFVDPKIRQEIKYCED